MRTGDAFTGKVVFEPTAEKVDAARSCHREALCLAICHLARSDQGDHLGLVGTREHQRYLYVPLSDDRR